MAQVETKQDRQPKQQIAKKKITVADFRQSNKAQQLLRLISK